MPSLIIGSRWAPGTVERRDTQTGHYEAVNSQLLTTSEIQTQRALLAPVIRQDSLERIEAARVARRVVQVAGDTQ